MSDDATRLRELEDREAIRQIFVDYARYIDAWDHAGYASLFARNGVMVASLGDAVGPAAIETMMAKFSEKVDEARREGNFNATIHLMGNHDIRLSGDTATAEVVWSYLTTDPDKIPTILQMGRYHDDLVREDGVWKIARHEIKRIMGRAQIEPPHPSRLDAAAQRLRELEDKEAIRQVFVDYARFLDNRDFEGYASLFAQTGFMKASLGEAIGPRAILNLLNKYRDVSAGKNLPTAVHVMNNHDIAVDGDTAKANVLWFYLTTDPDGVPMVLQSGRYTDDLVRERGVWKLVSHDISRIMGRAPFDPPPVTRLDHLEQRLKKLEDRVG